jgi:hypothetical protein
MTRPGCVRRIAGSTRRLLACLLGSSAAAASVRQMTKPVAMSARGAPWYKSSSTLSRTSTLMPAFCSCAISLCGRATISRPSCRSVWMAHKSPCSRRLLRRTAIEAAYIHWKRTAEEIKFFLIHGGSVPWELHCRPAASELLIR